MLLIIKKYKINQGATMQWGVDPGLIEDARVEAKRMQEVAAGMCGVGTKFLSQLENGKETAELGKTLQVLRKMGLEIYIYPRSANPFKE